MRSLKSTHAGGFILDFHKKFLFLDFAARKGNVFSRPEGRTVEVLLKPVPTQSSTSRDNNVVHRGLGTSLVATIAETPWERVATISPGLQEEC
jgi:hypothetical protein